MDTDLYWQQFLEKGDNNSFSIIYNHYVDELYSYGVHLGFQDEICKDAIQDVFYKLYISRKKLHHIKKLSAYIFKFYKNRLIDITRKNERTENIDSFDGDISIQNTILDDIIDVENLETVKKKVKSLLDKLSKQQREMIYMKYIYGLNYEEISKVLGINTDSVRKFMCRTMKKLREQAGDDR
ncbi:MAG: RNA polymerase sigma factor [Tannerella sp.]|jgi:RNA polymerase sigma factor (sigma-70 family)|nr:RNA polymerase sigma factor [Tannerella sp.]